MRIFKLLILFFLIQVGNQIFCQTDKLEAELKNIALTLDSLTKDNLNRSAFLDRGMGEDFQLYDSLSYQYYEKLRKYIANTTSLEQITNVLTVSTDVIEANNKRIFQWEYISGGTQEQTNKLIQIIYTDSIQVISKEFSENTIRTYGLYFLDNDYLEFESIKGCRTCCKEIITFKGEQIYSIDYRNEFIEQLFTYDSLSKTIKIKLTDIFIEGLKEEDSSILNETLILEFDGKEFIKQE